MPPASFASFRKKRGFGRTFAVAVDAKYSPESADPRTPFVPKLFSSVATLIVAPDGTGDYEDIQEAINALPAAGGIIYLKEGTYTITAKITFGKSNVVLIGSGRASQIKAGSSFPNTTAMLDTESNSYITIESLYVNGDSVGTGIDGIRIGSGTGCIIRNCYVESLSDVGIYVNATTTADVFTLISGNIIKSCANAILVQNSSKIIVSGNNCYSNTAGGILVQTSPAGGARPTEVLIAGNICALNSGGSSDGISFTEIDDSIISGNISVDNGRDGIRLEGHPITANTCEDNIVANNRCSGNSGRGIYIADSKVTNTLVHGNQLRGNTTANYTDSGTTTTSADNVTA